MIYKVIISILAITALVISMSACAVPGSATSITEPDYAGPITESLLLALNNGDFSQFSRDFDDGMKKSVTQETFNTQFITGIKGKIGDYEPDSRRFFSASSQDQYTTVVYSSIFTNEPGAVLVQISFRMVNGSPLVSGLFFNSPKLRG